MEYRFLNTTDEDLLEACALPTEEGIAIAVRTTGYVAGEDELVELAIADLEGNNLFCQRVKPQNVEDWTASDSSGGLTCADVEECPELYQFEDEIIELIDKASVVVAEHLDFALAMIEASWVSIPAVKGVDLVDRFRACHCTADYPGEPATAASLDAIAAYFKIGEISAQNEEANELALQAASVAACYRAFVKEQNEVREGKGEQYWKRREERLAQKTAQDAQQEAIVAKRNKRMNQMNGLLWVSGALIFIALAIQLYQRGGDVGLIVICGAVAVFNVIRAVANFRK